MTNRGAAVRDVEVAIVGGGPAGAAVAALLAERGREVVMLEQSPEWRWKACGVFTSPAAVAALRRTGLDAGTLDRVARAIPAMRVETPGGTAFRLTYGDEDRLAAPAVGFDRSALDPAMLALARARGADVHEGAQVRAIRLAAGRSGRSRLEITGPAGETTVDARLVVGADGSHSTVARAAGVVRDAPLGKRIGMTFHLPDPEPGPHDARMRVIGGAYVGLAPVPGGRLNVGIVLSGESWMARLRAEGARSVSIAVTSHALPGPAATAEPLDHVAGSVPLGHQVARRSGPGWLLVGDAAGFLDPFTGEGLHRALVSAELAAAAIDAELGGNRRAGLRAYDRSMRRRFRSKDAVSILVQAFLARPAAFEYVARRLADRTASRETMGLVMGDLVPASRGLSPRFLAGLLRP